jgi:DNA-binding transcriptional regulator YiaG
MEASATTSRKVHTFSSATYLEGLMAELDRAAISIRMGQARDLAGLKQPEMADLLEVHFRTIQDWESPKKRVVPFDRLEEWARLTETTREWLLHGEMEATEEDRLRRIVREELEALRGDLDRIENLLRSEEQARSQAETPE